MTLVALNKRFESVTNKIDRLNIKFQDALNDCKGQHVLDRIEDKIVDLEEKQYEIELDIEKQQRKA